MSFEILKLQNDTTQLDQRSGILLYTATRNPEIFCKKTAFSHPNIVSAKKCSAKNYTCRILEKKSSFEPAQKKNFHVVPFQKQKKKVFDKN